MKRTHDCEKYDIDFSRKVFVYKNLHKGCWSIKQDGLVKAHSDGTPITLYFTEMKVNRKGRERVLREKRKNVHAGIEGYLSHEDSHVWHGWVDMVEISYNPYKHYAFYNVETKKSRWYADICKLYQDKVLVERVLRGIPFLHNPVYNEAENCLTQSLT